MLAGWLGWQAWNALADWTDRKSISNHYHCYYYCSKKMMIIMDLSFCADAHFNAENVNEEQKKAA